MPSSIQAPELKSAVQTYIVAALPATATYKAVLEVDAKLLWRRIYLAGLLWNQDSFTNAVYYGELRFFLKNMKVGLWKFYWRQAAEATQPGSMLWPTDTISVPALVAPPFSVETVLNTAAAAFPVDAPGSDEIAVTLLDTERDQTHKVRMRPIKTFGHFDKLEWEVTGGADSSTGASTQALSAILACHSTEQPA